MTKPTHKIPPLMSVKSSSVAELGFENGHLFVRFTGGGLYRYPGVSAEQFSTVRNAKSVGKALQVEILSKHTGQLVPEVDGA